MLPGRLYEITRDPEGLLSNIPALATILIGMLTGLWLRTRHSMRYKVTGLFLAGICGLLLGEIWSIWFPINKKLWTSSYVLLAAGWTLLSLALCSWLIEIRQWKHGWTKPWSVFGSNAIVAYVLSELMTSTLYSLHAQYGGLSVALPNLIFEKCFSWIVNPSFGSLLYSLTFVLVCYLPVAVLYRKRIFIKI
jgi:predicted acyltransferase